MAGSIKLFASLERKLFTTTQGEDTFLLGWSTMVENSKTSVVVDLIRNRPDLNYFQIAVVTGSNLTAICKAARVNNCQRKRGGGPKKPQVVNG
jgi:hypothetical protein